MKNSLIFCSMIVGLFKTRLHTREREEFKEGFEIESHGFFKTRGLVREGKNSLVVYFPSVIGAKGDDPMNSGGTCVISFRNGGKELKDCQVPTEQGLNGSWAMAIVDDRQGISLGRDVAGAQSMYFAKMNDVFYFASSLTLFRMLPFTIDPDAISEFLHYLYIPAPRTIYREVKSVLPGQIVSFDGKNLKEAILPRKNFGEDQPHNQHLANPEQLLIDYQDLLKKSVQISCSKKGKTALFLSGGKDSSALAIAVKRGGLRNVEAVTLGFDEREIDESDDAKIVADHLGFPFRQLKFPMETYLKYWPEFIRCFGQPMGDCAALPVFVGMKESYNNYDVFLDGTGNDRYMGITTTWQEDLAWYIHRRIPGLHRLPWRFVPSGYSYSVDTLARFLSKPREEQFVSWNGWTLKEITKLTGRKPNWQNNPLYRLCRNCSSSMVHKTLTLCDVWEPETAYRKVVQVANIMGKSVRFPFLDRDLVKFSQNLPSAYQYEGRINKIILRLFLKKYLPEKIVNKKKGAFVFPKNYILASNNYEFLDIFLSSDCIREYGWVDDSIVNLYVQKYKKGDKSLEDRIWALVLLHAWAELRGG
ncbi:asparagine synthase [bacterium]|nr:asparagine synthase [bacterium]